MEIRRVKNELYHHGIKGQEWGVRNGPPYPLNQKAAKKVKAQADYKQKRKRIGKDKRLKTSGLSKLSSAKDREWLEVIAGFSDTEGGNEFNVAKKIGEGGWSPDAGWISDNDVFENGERNHSWVTDNDLRVTNIGYDSGWDYQKGTMIHARGTTSNCTKCTATMELRRRGFDVVAGRQSNGSLNTAHQYWFDGAVAYKEKYTSAVDRLTKFGRRATAAIDFRYPNGGGGHSMYVQNNEFGKPVYFDGQNGTKYFSIDDVYNRYGFDKGGTVLITRLDNATPNWKHLEEDSVCRRVYSDKSHNKVKNKKTGRIVDTW